MLRVTLLFVVFQSQDKPSQNTSQSTGVWSAVHRPRGGVCRDNWQGCGPTPCTSRESETPDRRDWQRRIPTRESAQYETRCVCRCSKRTISIKNVTNESCVACATSQLSSVVETTEVWLALYCSTAEIMHLCAQFSLIDILGLLSHEATPVHLISYWISPSICHWAENVLSSFPCLQSFTGLHHFSLFIVFSASITFFNNCCQFARMGFDEFWLHTPGA